MKVTGLEAFIATQLIAIFSTPYEQRTEELKGWGMVVESITFNGLENYS